MSSAPDAARYMEMRLSLVCPNCGSSGLVPWEHLDRVLYCRRCEVFFRVEPTGLVELEEFCEDRISVEVRSSSSGWSQHVAVVVRPLSVGRRLQQSAVYLAANTWARGLAIGSAVLLLVASIGLSTRESARARPVDLPMALDERAILFADALALRDLDVLIRLTDPAEHRALRIWLAHGKDLPPEVASRDPAIKSKLISKNLTTAKGSDANIKVRLSHPPSEKELVIDERWSQRGDTWYFRPVRLRSPRFAPTRPAEIKRGRAAR